MSPLRRFARLTLVAALLGGCAVHGRGPLAVAGSAPAVLAHLHGPDRGRFWGYYLGFPVYCSDGVYAYWNGSVFAPLPHPPTVVRASLRHYHHYYPRGHLYYRPPVHHPPAIQHGPPQDGDLNRPTHPAKPGNPTQKARPDHEARPAR